MLYQEYMQEYIRMEKFCKDALGDDRGVTAYIEQMDRSAVRSRSYVPTWDSDYQTLKHLRHLRNRLTHESYAECSQEDYDRLCRFYQRFLNQTDPLSLARKARIDAKRRSKPHTASHTPPTRSPAPPPMPNHSSGSKSCLIPILLILLILGLIAVLTVVHIISTDA